MNDKLMPCDDRQLAAMLATDDHDGQDEAWIGHVEICPRCQSRLRELAADAADWRKASQVLGMPDDEEPMSPRGRDVATTWNESMVKPLLDPPTHPEMLGRLGRYEIESLLGSGGMGIVFKAFDTELNRPVAIKMLAPYLSGNSSARKRFAREARAAAGVVNDHVVPIFNVESEGDPPFLVMQYIAGRSLQEKLDRDGPLEVAEVLRIGLQASKGLAAAHAQGVIHRDVKPSNILLDEGVERALITDFGLARAEQEISLTHSGFHPGTPQYMSPEQVRGEAIDGRSDLFGLGCVLYALLTGHSPFRAESSYAVLRRITDDSPRPMRESHCHVPEWLEKIVMKLLAKTPDDRFDTAAEVAELLEDCLAHVQQPTITPLPKAVTRFLPQRRVKPPAWKWLVAGAAALGLLAAGVLMVLETGKGTLTIESPADDVAIRIKQHDHTVRRLVVSQKGETIRLSAGQYTLELEGTETRYDVTDGIVVVKRGENQIARITYKENQGDAAPWTEQRPLATALREFNHLHAKDAEGNLQQPLSQSEVLACLLWMMGNDELAYDVVKAIQPILFTRHRLVPAGWQFTGGLTRQRCDQGVVQTWEIQLDTNGLSPPIFIRQRPVAPPSSLRQPTEKLDEQPGSTPLATAIDEFNASQEERDDLVPTKRRAIIHGLELPALTLDDVLAAIALWQSKRDEAQVDDATFERLQRIAATHQLPADVRFELVPARENAIGQWFHVWWYRLLVPRVDKPESTYAFTISHRFIEHDRYNPAATHWGPPGGNGLQAGFRLIPGQPTYQHDQVVDIEFVYRSVTGQEVPATLSKDFRYDQVILGQEVVYAPVLDVQQRRPSDSIRVKIGPRPTVVKGHRMQLCTDPEAEVKDGVTVKAIIEPNKGYNLHFVVPNPGDDASGELLETGKSHYFNTPPLTPPQPKPAHVGHWYRHWTYGMPGSPADSTPDPEYMDPFQIGASLGPADKSRIPTYYAGGLQVTRVAPYSPASVAGIEVGDILLSWEGHQIHGEDASGNFFKYAAPYKQLQETLESLHKLAKLGVPTSQSMKFVLLDHRTGEVIDIAPAFGLANGFSKSQGLQRVLQRKANRNEEK